MSDVFVIFGPPGTGKTFFLTKTVFHLVGYEDWSDLHAQYGLDFPLGKYKLDDITYVSFMNSAVEEVTRRLGVRRGYDNGRFGTIAGLSISLLIKSGVLAPEEVGRYLSSMVVKRRIFASKMGLPYDPEDPTLGLKGNEVFNVYSYIVHALYPKYRDMDRAFDRALSLVEDEELVHYAEAWHRFKGWHRDFGEKFFDFDDFQRVAWELGVPLPGKVFIVDEFQDLSPLQFELFKQWSEDKDLVMVAGDDDQTILSELNGADARQMLGLEGEKIVLKKSFRLGKEARDLSKAFIEALVKDRYPKEFDHNGSSTKIHFIQVPSMRALAKGAVKIASSGRSVMILLRTNALVRAVESYLVELGVKYHRFKEGVSVWDKFFGPFLRVKEALDSGGFPREADLEKVFRFLDIGEVMKDRVRQAVQNRTYTLDLAKFKTILTKEKYFRMAISREQLERAFAGQVAPDILIERLWEILTGKVKDLPGDIYVDTIHSAKGREADVVILVDFFPEKVLSNVEEDDIGVKRENEARVWYVGMTRVKEALIIAQVGGMEGGIVGVLRRLIVTKSWEGALSW